MTWSLSASHELREMRAAYGTTLERLIGEGQPVVVCDADLASSSGAGSIWMKHPERAADFGICESNMVSAAAAMSRVGMRAFVHSFAPFVSRRVFDQVYISAGFARQDLHIYASDPGLWSLYNGATHTTFEDVALMRTVPGASVVAPADTVSFSWVLRWYAENGGLVYDRAPRKPLPQVYAEGSEFNPGRGQLLREGSDIALIALGSCVSDALRAADLLAERGVSASVVDLFFVKPVDEKLVLDMAANHRALLTIENHGGPGGIGELVGGLMSRFGSHARLGCVCVGDRYGEVGTLEYLKKTLGISVDDIVAKACELTGNP